MSKQSKWYRRYVEEKFASIKKIDNIREQSLRLQAREYKRRLQDLNGEAQRLRDMQATYIPREVYENSLQSVLEKTEAAARSVEDRQQELVDKTIQPMHTWQTKLQGKIAIIVIVGGAVWGVVVAIMFWVLNNFFK